MSGQILDCFPTVNEERIEQNILTTKLSYLPVCLFFFNLFYTDNVIGFQCTWSVMND